MDLTSRMLAFIGIRALYRRYSVKRHTRQLAKAVERHARASNLPDDKFSDEGGRLDKLRFLRREHMYLDWSSWHSAIRDD